MSSTVTVAEIAATIDHAILKPELTRAEVDEQLALVARYGVFSACVRPSDVMHAYEVLEGSGVAVCAVIGFPHGTTTTQTKVAEATEAGEGDRIDSLIGALHQVQLEITRMENQEAIIDGFGVMSGRVKGAAVNHSS